jgi:anthranilate phosphoribosyltransferase
MTYAVDIPPLLRRLAAAQPLAEAQAHELFNAIMTGQATDAQIGSLLTALAVRPGGPSVEEITGAARAMRDHVTCVNVPSGVEVIDTCGTGGDHASTFNISTAAALIAAGAGAHVAKHGNRSVTSSSGSSQVLEALGVKLLVTGPTLTRCLEEARLCFCFAQAHHPAMKHAAPARQQLGFRTIFNLLGPLSNPAGAKRQLLGVFEPGLTVTLARVLQNLGATHAMIVHGEGLDEITLAGPSQVTRLERGSIETFTVTPEDFGLKRTPLEVLKVKNVEESAAMIRAVLAGEKGPARDIASLNAAAALVVAGQAASLPAGLQQAHHAIDTGAAKRVLEQLVQITHA